MAALRTRQGSPDPVASRSTRTETSTSSIRRITESAVSAPRRYRDSLLRSQVNTDLKRAYSWTGDPQGLREKSRFAKCDFGCAGYHPLPPTIGVGEGFWQSDPLKHLYLGQRRSISAARAEVREARPLSGRRAVHLTPIYASGQHHVEFDWLSEPYFQIRYRDRKTLVRPEPERVRAETEIADLKFGSNPSTQFNFA